MADTTLAEQIAGFPVGTVFRLSTQEGDWKRVEDGYVFVWESIPDDKDREGLRFLASLTGDPDRPFTLEYAQLFDGLKETFPESELVIVTEADGTGSGTGFIGA